MPLDSRDAACIWDMVNSGETIVQFTRGFTLREYMADRKLQLAVERLMEIIGEAARGVSDGARASFPQVPWRSIVAQRNVLAHEYGDVKHERLWLVIQDHVPRMVAVLKAVVAQPPR